jgi:hypothetical protein
MPLQATSGAASYDGFGGGVVAEPNYIESCFSTWLYTGNGSTQTITNGIDLAGEGGLVWAKERPAPSNHYLVDTVRGVGNNLKSNTTDAQQAIGLNSFTSTGFTTGSFLNDTGSPYASWTFRKQPKFFDVVTYTGNGTAGRTVAHNLGSVPGFIVVKRLDFTSAWPAIHRGNGTNWQRFWLNQTSAGATPPNANWWGDGSSFIAPTSTNFTLGTNSEVNTSDSQYVAYLWAHDAGGFGLTGTDNVISCGSFSVPPEGPSTAVTLGYEPQWLLVKKTNAADNWIIFDTMRGWKVGTAATDANDESLWPNLSDAANPDSGGGFPTATGFVYPQAGGASDSNYIYIAIRRGPMKVPTSGTSVFSPIVATSGTGTTNFPVDMQILSDKGSTNAILNQQFVDRLRGVSSTTTAQGNYLLSSSTAAESSAYPNSSKLWSNTGFGIPLNYEGASSLYLSFRRAPSFFDEVCYTGTEQQGKLLIII